MASGLVAGPPEVEAQVSANVPSGRRRTALIACGIPQVPASTRIPVGLREPLYAPFPIWIWLIGHEWAKRQCEKASIGYTALDNPLTGGRPEVEPGASAVSARDRPAGQFFFSSSASITMMPLGPRT
jgi:hypothetical protein